MIDMRTDLGEVQHDGFEYNWSFRDNHWHATIGKLSTGAWVRRRRWVRLMMRPATHNPLDLTSSGTLTSPSSSLSLVGPASKLSSLVLDASHVWNGGEQDWQHVHRLLRLLGRDGRKLELWRMWLGPYAQISTLDTKGKAKQSDLLPPPSQHYLSDVVPEENSPPLVHLTTILRNHVRVLL